MNYEKKRPNRDERMKRKFFRNLYRLCAKTCYNAEHLWTLIRQHRLFNLLLFGRSEAFYLFFLNPWSFKVFRISE